MKEKNELSKKWESLTFANNFLFCKIMESEPELCRQLLELLLHIRIEKLQAVQAEKTGMEGMDSKSVRFDVYTLDDKRVFDIEIQTSAKKNLPKRARYYQSIMDILNLSHGEDYRNLKESYVIFLCLEDIFKKSLPVYCFENICREDQDIKLGDGTCKVFFNAKDCDKMENSEERCFFEFLKGQKAQTDFTRELEKHVNQAKRNVMWRNQYMTWQQSIDEEVEIAVEEAVEKAVEEAVGKAVEEAVEKAVEETSENTARKLLKNGVNPQLVAECTGIPLEKVLSL